MKREVKTGRNTTYRFWRQDNQPQELYSPSLFFKRETIFIIILLNQALLKKRGLFIHQTKDYHATKKCGLFDLELL